MNILPSLQLSIKMVHVYRPSVYHACDCALSGAFADRESIKKLSCFTRFVCREAVRLERGELSRLHL